MCKRATQTSAVVARARAAITRGDILGTFVCMVLKCRFLMYAKAFEILSDRRFLAWEGPQAPYNRFMKAEQAYLTWRRVTNERVAPIRFDQGQQAQSCRSLIGKDIYTS